jgi:hypothetical protein
LARYNGELAKLEAKEGSRRDEVQQQQQQQQQRSRTPSPRKSSTTPATGLRTSAAGGAHGQARSGGEEDVMTVREWLAKISGSAGCDLTEYAAVLEREKVSVDMMYVCLCLVHELWFALNILHLVYRQTMPDTFWTVHF